MGSSLSTCCSSINVPKINIFSSDETKTIHMSVMPPSSITTMNMVYGKQQEALTIHNFDVLKILGTGAFGKVLLVRLKKTFKLYALKIISKKKIRNDYSLNGILKEREILIKSNHPFIIKLRYSFQDSHFFFFLMDYMKGGPISNYIQATNGKGFCEKIVRFYACQVLLALECLHEKMNVVYRDLKPDNILLDEHGNVQLADFGISEGYLISWKGKLRNLLRDSDVFGSRNY